MFNRKKSIQFLRFGIVGIGNTALDFSLFFLLTYASIPYLPAQIVAYSAGIANSYYWNRNWTFRVQQPVHLREIVKFITINGLSLALSSILLLTSHSSAHSPLWIAKFLATAGGIIVNFLGSHIWVFRMSTENPDPF